jgi:putative tryptophan/tyrosine transport system substrate-binding protein
MKRREFIALVAGAASWPHLVRAQPAGRIRTVGVFWGMAPNDPMWRSRFEVFTRTLQDLGWRERGNIVFEVRHAVGDPERYASLVRELVERRADVIVVTSAGLAAVARQVTATVPIVTTSAGDLEGSGLIETLQRPGGNVTGMQSLNPDLMSKRVELLKEVGPNIVRLAIIKPITPAGIITARYLEVIKDAAKALGVQVYEVPVHSPDQFGPAFSAIARAGHQAAIVIGNPLSLTHRHEVIASAAKHRIPTIYEARAFAVDGGLVSCGVEPIHLFQGAAAYVDKILKGAPAGTLPVQQATKFELVINLKTAKALELTIPQLLLARADELIE